MPPDLLGPGALATALIAALGVLWKLHLDDDKRRDKESDDWKAIALGNQGDLAKLVPAVADLTKTVGTEHDLAKLDRDLEQRFRDELRGTATRIEAKIDARRPR